MLALAKLGEWDAVSSADSKRLQILQEQNGSSDNNHDEENPLSRQLIIDEILDLDTNIKELASNERQSAMDEEIRQQAQVAAQTSYKQALTPDTGL